METTQAAATTELIEAMTANMYTMLPGEIVLYNGVSATVKPVLKKKFLDGEELPYPEISGVPVRALVTNRGGLSMDLLPGDPGLLFFAARDCANYINTGKTNAPETSRKFDYNDCFFIPFESRKNEVDSNYKPLTTTLYRSDAGNINFKNAAESHAGLMSEFFDLMSSIQTVGSPGNHVGSPAWTAQVIALKTRYIILSGA